MVSAYRKLSFMCNYTFKYCSGEVMATTVQIVVDCTIKVADSINIGRKEYQNALYCSLEEHNK